MKLHGSVKRGGIIVKRIQRALAHTIKHSHLKLYTIKHSHLKLYTIKHSHLKLYTIKHSHLKLYTITIKPHAWKEHTVNWVNKLNDQTS